MRQTSFFGVFLNLLCKVGYEVGTEPAVTYAAVGQDIYTVET